MKYYIGSRGMDGCDVRVLRGRDGMPFPLHPQLHLVAYSPTGFAWGYRGSGPTQLALATKTATSR